MGRLIQRLTVLILAVLIFSFIGALIVSSFAFTEKFYLRSFKTSWIFSNSLVWMFKYFMPIITALILLGYSYFYAGKQYYRGATMPGIVSPALALFLFLTLLFTVFQEGFIPGQLQKLDMMKYRTRLAREFETEYQDLLLNEDGTNVLKMLTEEDSLETRKYIHLYLSIDPDNEKALSALDAVTEELRRFSEAKKDEKKTAEAKLANVSETIKPLLEKTEELFNRREFFHAIYLANRVLDLDSNNYTAKRIIARSWDEITSVDLSEKDQETRENYITKMEAYSVLYDANDPVKAYYLLKDLKEKLPNDADINRYYDEAWSRMQKLSFFIEDIDMFLEYEGNSDIFFLNYLDSDSAQFIRIEKITVFSEGIFCKNIEVMNVSFSQGRMLYHVAYPYGKIIHDELIIQAVSRDNPGKSVPPEIFYTAEGVKYPDTSIKLQFTFSELISMSEEKKNFSVLNVPQLLDLKKVMLEAGYPVDSININIITHLQKPFTFLLLCFIALLAGLIFHLQDTKKRRVVYILSIPVPVIISVIVVNIVSYCSQLINGLLYFLVGFSGTIIFLIIINLILLLVLLIILAGQRINE